MPVQLLSAAERNRANCFPSAITDKPLFRTFLTEPPASVATQFGPIVEHSQAHEGALAARVQINTCENVDTMLC
jgi:hypothetical protein